MMSALWRRLGSEQEEGEVIFPILFVFRTGEGWQGLPVDPNGHSSGPRQDDHSVRRSMHVEAHQALGT